MTINCLACGAEYERPRARMSHYCADCRAAQNRARNAERKREARAAERAARERVDHYEGMGMSSEYIERYHDLIDDVLDELRGGLALLPSESQHDRMPAGSFTPAGSADGISTYFTDLAEWLDEDRRRIAAHPWWTANPHWAFGLGGDDVDLGKLRTA